MLPRRRIQWCSCCRAICDVREVTLFLAITLGFGYPLLLFELLAIWVDNLHIAGLFGFL